ENVEQFEIRASLRFGPLDKPRVVYRLDLDKDGQASKLNLRADGSLVPAPVRPGQQNRAYLGLAFEKNTTTVSQVFQGGPAAQAGIKAGDKILALDKTKIASVPDLLKELQTRKPGTEVTLYYERGDQTIKVTLKLAAPPAP